MAGEANAKLCMSHLMIEVLGGTLSACTVIHEACAILLQGVSPIPKKISPYTDLGVPAWCSLSRYIRRHDRVNVSYRLCFVCVYVCACACMHICCVSTCL